MESHAGRWFLPALLAGLCGGILAADAGVTVTVLAAPIGVLLAIPGRRWLLPLTVAAALAGLGIGTVRALPAAPVPGSGVARAAPLADGAERTFVGTVSDDPRPREDRLQLVVGGVATTIDGSSATRLADRLLVWVPRGVDLSNGDRIRFSAELTLPRDFDGFAYREYLERQGIGAIARPFAVEVIGREGGVGPAVGALRGMLLEGLNRLVPEPEAALGAGILLGVRGSIDPDLNDAFARAGLTHVVAISGWNIAIVTAIVMGLLRPLERRPGGRWTVTGIAVALVAGYVLLTGASPSVVRAALMAGCLLAAKLGGSRTHAASALGLAAMLMLLAAPSVLWDVGFQLSLLATAGLVWFGAAVESRVRWLPPLVREPIALTLAAQLTTLPIILVNFERLSLVAPIANVLVVPFVPLAMATSAAAALAGTLVGVIPLAPVAEAVGWLGGAAAWACLRIIIALGSAVASVPNAAVDVRVPGAVAMAWLPLLGLAAWALGGAARAPATESSPRRDAMPGGVRRLARPAPLLTCAMGVLLGITLLTGPDGRLHVTVLDIGQGDAILVEAPSGARMLVDGGPDPERTLRRLGAELPFHARRIDVLVVSHPHQDHVAGLVDVLDRFDVGLVLHAGIPFENPAYDRLLADAARSTVPVRVARAGDRLALDAQTSVEVLYPSADEAAAPLPEEDINNGSIVLLVRYGGFAALLTGDAEAPVEERLLAAGRVGPVDVLKVGHHGSTSSTTASFLDATAPAVAVISVGADNDYGHPAPETLETLTTRPGLLILRTDLDGDVEVETDGRVLRVGTDYGWSETRPVHADGVTGSIGPWPFPIARLRADCSTRPRCPTGSSSIPRASRASPWPGRRWSRRPGYRSTSTSWRRRRCCTTSTSSTSARTAASTGSSARDGSRRSATPSSPCRSPPIRSRRSSTRTASRSAGRRSWWPSPTGTWPRSSSRSTSAWTT